MMGVYAIVPVLIYAACLAFCWAGCPPEIGQPLDLNQFKGDWFMVAGTPVAGKSLSKCGKFKIEKTSWNSFTMKYTALSHRDHSPVTFNVRGHVGKEVIGNWQLQGSKRVLGPFRHIIISVDYDTVLAMVVCSENNSPYLPGHKFSMIWSRERSLPLPIFERVKLNLAAYINEEEILMADHRNC